MSWLNIFRGNNTNKSHTRSHLQNLIEMAKADGYYDQVEKDYLLKIAKSYNITAKNMDEVEKYSGQVAMAQSGNSDMVYRQLYELVGMMLADGIVHNSEIELCVRFAEEMGVAQGNGSSFIGKLVKAIEQGANEADVKKIFA
ncbi:MAG: TerB family tellurite resistance protein [Raineya sp.]|jgi:uncharacterized tellurite resistance protein B-like protein|nr:TerB family tellurite resistance protein [Raineya sp.]